MKIILNAESLYKLRSGIGHYTRHLLSGMLQEKTLKDIYCFQGTGWLMKPPSLEDIQKVNPAQTKKNNVIGKIRSFPYLYEAYSYYKNHQFSREAWKIKNAVYHEPNFILKPYDGATVASIHDLSHIHYPDYHPRERVNYLNKHLPRTIETVTHIITDSSFVADELMNGLGVSPERVTSIHPGIDPCFQPMEPSQLTVFLKKYKLKPRKYILSVATLEPRKNIEGLLDAYLRLDQKIRREYPLVLVGAKGWRNKELLHRIQGLMQKGEVYYLGYVPDEDLPFLYAGAQAFIYVPFYEGFGFPALEALGSGVPLITSNVSSLPEVVGNAALLVNPYDTVVISEGLMRLIEDEALRNTLIRRGLKRAQKFVWQNCVNETLSIYKKVLTR